MIATGASIMTADTVARTIGIIVVEVPDTTVSYTLILRSIYRYSNMEMISLLFLLATNLFLHLSSLEDDSPHR